MWLTHLGIRNPVGVAMAMIALVVLGVFACRKLPVALLPDIDFPLVVVETDYPGAAPETVENE
ncbi:MAG TPA: efflux RND transporter permease subunit, partial [Methylococcaceae bacterium]|nr:efflux RND transporter permease subunit [Methylococcaceae bacterium]